MTCSRSKPAITLSLPSLAIDPFPPGMWLASMVVTVVLFRMKNVRQDRTSKGRSAFAAVLGLSGCLDGIARVTTVTSVLE